MTMPSSGQLNMAQTTSPVSVALELGRGLTSTISMNDSDVRALAGVGGSGTQWSMNSLYGKSARSFSLASMVDVDGTAFPPDTAYAEWVFYADGTMGYFTSNGSSSMGNWTTPATAGIGSSYWIRVTETYSTGGFTITGSGRGIWNQLNVAQYFGISRGLGGYGQSINTIEISTNSSGTNIVATRTGMNLIAEVIF